MGSWKEKNKMKNTIVIWLFQLGKSGDYSFRYFTKDKSFTKSHIISELSKIPESKDYSPDDINASSTSREYLFSVSLINVIFLYLNKIFETIAPAKYVELYNSYKKRLCENTVKNWANYTVYLNPKIAEKLKSYVPTEE